MAIGPVLIKLADVVHRLSLIERDQIFPSKFNKLGQPARHDLCRVVGRPLGFPLISGLLSPIQLLTGYRKPAQTITECEKQTIKSGDHTQHWRWSAGLAACSGLNRCSTQPSSAPCRDVLRPSPDNGYSGSRCSSCLFRRYAQGGVDPRPPSRSACGGSHCVARSRRRQPRFPSAPVGLPKSEAITPYHQHQLAADYAAPRIGLTTASVGTVAQYTAHSAINAARLANCEPR